MNNCENCINYKSSGLDNKAKVVESIICFSTIKERDFFVSIVKEISPDYRCIFLKNNYLKIEKWNLQKMCVEEIEYLEGLRAGIQITSLKIKNIIG
jgi:hypothetical protein